jgi:flagellar L-ring protein precursor FlgH
MTPSNSRSLILLLVAVMLLSGCTSFGKKMKAYFAGEQEKKPEVAKQINETGEPFDRDSMGQIPPRQYGRMTREKFESEAQVGPRSGSLWRNEGQGAYLFAENNFRLVGDLLSVKLDGAPKEQLVSKAKIIRDLWKKLDSQRSPASAKGKQGGPAPAAGGDTPAPAPAPAATADGKSPEGGAPAQAGVNPDEIDANSEEKPLAVEVVPTRVVGRTADGNYKVEGSQSFMIGKREYKVLVAGIVRAQDFNDEFVGATRLMDPKFDIVSTKKTPAAAAVTK